jgi:hypothetical protein
VVAMATTIVRHQGSCRPDLLRDHRRGSADAGIRIPRG